MKNKGFTLIEMLVVVVLIAVISTFVGVGVVKMLERQKDKNNQDYKDTVCNAALAYVELSTYTNLCKTNKTSCSITINELISNGLIARDLKNPIGTIAGEDTKTVTVTWNNGEKSCTYNG
jgi:prepilin-type N-terminal cleavage/methylation domain-containing protein